MDESAEGHRYVMVLSVPARCLGNDSFCVESAFAQHLHVLKAHLGDLAHRLIVVGPELDESAESDATLATIRAEEGIEFVPAFPLTVGRLGYLRRLPSVVRLLWREVGLARIVHAGPSQPQRMFEFLAIALAKLRGKHTIYITDIDHRRSPDMMLRTGVWSRRQYFMARWLWGPVLHLQHLYAVRNCSLVLLKGAGMVADYGQGRSNVKNFVDTAYGDTHVLDQDRLESKLSQVDEGPLRLVYFGRLDPRKGVDHMLRAVRLALDAGWPVQFEVIGDGPDRERLSALAEQLGLTAHVNFVGALAFGDLLFRRLYGAHVLLAAPLSEDTPRSAFDAFASGLAILAYDTYYYRELHDSGAPVLLVPWLDPGAMAQAISQLANNRQLLADLLRQARAYAVPNTQESWLDRRTQWTRDLAA